MRTLAVPLLAVALLLGASSAHAEMREAARWGVWSAWTGTGNENRPMCAMMVSGDIRSLQVKWQPGLGLFIHVRKDTWDVPVDVPMPITVQFDSDAPFKGTASRHAGIKHGKTIQYSLGYSDSAKRFMERFVSAYRMRVAFPGGSERDWHMSMEGSRVIANHFARCVVDLGHRFTGQPHDKPKAMPPTATQPTQPFRKDTTPLTPMPKTRPGITEAI